MEALEHFKFKPGTHCRQKVIFIQFEKDPELIKQVKSVEGTRWSTRKKLWYIADTPENRRFFNLEQIRQPSKEAEAELQKFRAHLLSRRYSGNTVKTYTDALHSFLLFMNEKEISTITNEDLVYYNTHYILKNNLSSSYQNQILNAVKLYFKTIRQKSLDLDKIYRPRREKNLPNVLSKEEVKAILEAHNNIKHKAMLSLIYSCGLRRSELLSLRLTDIDSKRNIVIIKQSKGKKDRITPLSPKILPLLRAYYIDYKPKVWLFEGKVPRSM